MVSKVGALLKIEVGAPRLSLKTTVDGQTVTELLK
jgi:hypothetical protein